MLYKNKVDAIKKQFVGEPETSIKKKIEETLQSDEERIKLNDEADDYMEALKTLNLFDQPERPDLDHIDMNILYQVCKIQEQSILEVLSHNIRTLELERIQNNGLPTDSDETLSRYRNLRNHWLKAKEETLPPIAQSWVKHMFGKPAEETKNQIWSAKDNQNLVAQYASHPQAFWRVPAIETRFQQLMLDNFKWSVKTQLARSAIEEKKKGKQKEEDQGKEEKGKNTDSLGEQRAIDARAVARYNLKMRVYNKIQATDIKDLPEHLINTISQRTGKKEGPLQLTLPPEKTKTFPFEKLDDCYFFERAVASKMKGKAKMAEGAEEAEDTEAVIIAVRREELKNNSNLNAHQIRTLDERLKVNQHPSTLRGKPVILGVKTVKHKMEHGGAESSTKRQKRS